MPQGHFERQASSPPRLRSLRWQRDQATRAGVSSRKAMRSGFDVIRGTPSRRLRYCSSPSRRSLMKSSAKNLSAAALCAECGAVVAFRCGGVSHPAWYANSADAQTNETRFQAALHHARRTQRMRCAPPARSGTRSGALAALLLGAGAAGTPLRVHALERRVGRSRATPKPWRMSVSTRTQYD